MKQKLKIRIPLKFLQKPSDQMKKNKVLEGHLAGTATNVIQQLLYSTDGALSMHGTLVSVT